MATNFPLLMTQYERYGSVGREEYIEVYIDECLDVDIMMLPDYNDFLVNFRCDRYIYNFEELDIILEGMDPVEVFRLATFSNVSYSDDYVRFRGDGNLESMTDYQVIMEMQDDRDFLRWYVENNEDLDEEEIEAAVEAANKLIAAGY